MVRSVLCITAASTLVWSLFGVGDAYAKTALHCRSKGFDYALEVINAGDRPDFRCNAHCEYVLADGEVQQVNFENFNVQKGERKIILSGTFKKKVIDSKGAKITCNK